MSAPAAIRAVFAEWRMVKTRKVLALVFEVPLEQQGEVLTILGAPMPDAEIWCGIARLNLSAAQPAEVSQRGGEPLSSRSEAGKQRYASASDMEKALIRAAQLPKDARFCAWVAGTRWNGGDGDTASEHTAIKHIRDRCCAGESRKLIAEDRDCYDAFMRMELQYLQDTGLAAAIR